MHLASLVLSGREKFPTESGLAQLYTEKPAPSRACMGKTSAERFPKEHLVYYQALSRGEPRRSEAAKTYPLVFIQEHTRWRTHSQWFNSPYA